MCKHSRAVCVRARPGLVFAVLWLCARAVSLRSLTALLGLNKCQRKSSSVFKIVYLCRRVCAQALLASIQS